MSHHYSGPALGFPHGDARLDLTDLYVFGKPGDDRKSILIMNVHPSFSLQPRGPTRSDPFAHEAIYELKIDTDGDSVADIAYRVRFSPFEGGAQTATLRCARGAAAALPCRDMISRWLRSGCKLLAGPAIVSTGTQRQDFERTNACRMRLRRCSGSPACCWR